MENREAVEILDRLFHAAISGWFRSSYASPTETQAASWSAIAEGGHCLIHAPTGSGKTLGGFLWSLNLLLQNPDSTTARPHRVLYVSPLKALNNDIRRNLEEPLAQIRESWPQELPQIEIAIRSGDSSSSEKNRILRHPPAILITTPESVNIMLTSDRGRENLAGITTVILDEIHVLLRSKRGTMLSANLERMEALVQHAGGASLQRIGMSATINPLSEACSFLGGYETPGQPRQVHLVSRAAKRHYELGIELGEEKFQSWWDRQIPLMARHIEQHTSTLIFCNSRRAAEKAAHLLNEHFGDKLVFPHHGSLSGEYRHWVEQELKDGRLRAVCATSSLELGIDIGSVDMVLMLQPPFSVSSAIQRIGRSMHQVNSVSPARFIPLHPRDMLNSLVMGSLVDTGNPEDLRVPRNCLDVLAQLIMSESAGRILDGGAFYASLRGSYGFSGLSRDDYERVLAMLSGRYESSRIPELKPRLLVRPDDGLLEGRQSNALLVYQSGGTIPDRGYYDLRLGSGEKIGELDEEFVFERSLGDRFTLGGRVWQIQAMDNQKVTVVPSSHSAMIAPFWKADAIGLDSWFCEALGNWLENQSAIGSPASPDQQDEQNPDGLLSPAAAEELELWLNAQEHRTGTELPHRHHLLVEVLYDPSLTPDLVHHIIHSTWGSAVNAGLMFCLQEKFRRIEGIELQAVHTDFAVICSLPLEYRDFDILMDISSHEIPGLLRSRLASSGLFGSRFRGNASRALLVTRKGFLQRTPLWVQRMKSQDLLHRVMEYTDFPIVKETWREVLEDDLDIPRLTRYLQELTTGKIRCSRIQSSRPSPFASDIMWLLNTGYLYRDDSLSGPLPKGSGLSTELYQGLIATDGRLPELEEGLIGHYLSRRRRTVDEYLPENESELRFYLNERRILCNSEIHELQEALEDFRPELSALLLDSLDAEGSYHDLAGSAETTRLWLHRSAEDLLADISLILEEWMDWQALVSPEQMNSLWGADPARLLLEHDLILRWNEGWMSPGVFDRLIRLNRSMRRSRNFGLSLEELQLRSAILHGIRFHAPGAEPFCTRDAEDLLDSLSACSLPAAQLLPSILSNRQGAVGNSEWKDIFRRLDLAWTGSPGGAVIFDLAENLPLIRNELINPDKEAGHTSPLAAHMEGGSYSAEQLYGRMKQGGAGTLDDLLDHMRNEVRHSRLACDSLEGLRILEKGSTLKPNPASRSRSSQTRRGYREWQRNYALPGNWNLIPDLKEISQEQGMIGNSGDPDNPGLHHERIREHILLLFSRYPLISKNLLYPGDLLYGWSQLLPVLRRMELAGEVLGGYFCDEAGGFQFMHVDSFEKGSEELKHFSRAGYWFWLHAQDPALLYKPENFRRHPASWVIYRTLETSAIPDLLVRSRGKVIDYVGDTDDTVTVSLRATVLIHFFRSMLMGTEGGTSSIRIETINEEPAADHPLGRELLSLGAVAGPAGLTVWKY